MANSYLQNLADRVDKERSIMMGFYGTPSLPVIIDMTKLTSLTKHRLGHVHDHKGNCIKNRFNAPKHCKVGSNGDISQNSNAVQA
jgi:hypothetical protein